MLMIIPVIPHEDAANLLFYLRQISFLDENVALRRYMPCKHDEESSANFYSIIAKYITPEEYTIVDGETKLLHFLAQLAQQCSGREALRLYILLAWILPSHRWTQYSHRLCAAPGRGYIKSLLEAYTQLTSRSARAIYRLLSPTFTPELALSVAATAVLKDLDIGRAGVSRLKLGV